MTGTHQQFCGSGAVAMLIASLACLGPAAVHAQQAVAPIVANLQAKPLAPDVRLVTVRLFIDLECPFSRQVWLLWREAVRDRAGVTLLVQHLPLTRHPHALAAALAAVAARQQGRELEFIDFLLHDPVPDAGAVARAVRAAGLDADAIARFVEAPQARAIIDRERQAGLAFGIQATPSALVNGRGIGGVPPEPALRRALDVATAESRALLSQVPTAMDRAGVDPERIGLLRHAPEFMLAFEAMRAGRALSVAQPATTIVGQVGERFRTPIFGHDIAIGPPAAPVTAVLLLDPAVAWQVAQLRDLLVLQGNGRLRVVIKAVPRLDAQGQLDRRAGAQDAVHFLTALAIVNPEAAARIAVESAQRASMTRADFEVRALAAGLDVAAVRKIAEQPATIGRLYQTVELAVRTQARAGALFLNGRRWLGLTTDTGLEPAMQALSAEFHARARQGTPATETYAALIQAGRWRTDAELDLQPAEELGDTTLLPVFGDAGPDVHLFVDFASPHSRAAFYMLRRLVDDRDLPIRLHMASIASAAEPCVTTSGAAFIAATAAGNGMAMAEWLFSAKNPNDWKALFAEVKRQKRTVADFQKQVDAPTTRAVSRATATLKNRLDMTDEPVLYIGAQLYAGPLDETRIQQAIRFVRSPTPTSPATTAPR